MSEEPKITIEALRAIIREEIAIAGPAPNPIAEWFAGALNSLTNYWTVGVGLAIANWPAIEKFFADVVLPSLSPEGRAWIAPILGILYSAAGVALRQKTKVSLRAKGRTKLKGTK